MTLLFGLAAVGAIFCAAQALRSARLIASAVWLAGLSALLAVLLYLLGADEVAVIELSVGAGLVTILFVFAVGLAGAETSDARPLVPRWLAWLLSGLPGLLLARLLLPGWPPALPGPAVSFSAALWEARGLDVLVQIVLVFGGVLGILALLGEAPAPGAGAAPGAPVRAASEQQPQAAPQPEEARP